MKKIIQLALMIAAGCCLTSCYLFQMIGGGDNAEFYDRAMYSPMSDARAFCDTTNRKLIILPMKLYAKPKHLAYFKEYLDVKKEQGYVVYYETIDLCAQNENLTTDQIDTLRRKFRRVVGYDLNAPLARYNDKIGKQFYRDNHILTPWLDSLGLTTTKDFHVDMSLAQIVDSYQQNYKQINLTPSDFSTPLNAPKYLPSDTVAHAKYYMLYEPRAQYIVEQVVNSSNPKIIVVCSEDLMGYMLRPLFQQKYRSKYGYGAQIDLQNHTSQK